MTEFEEKIKARKARVGVVGLGYVGLPLAVEFAKAGFSVLGIDVLPEKVHAVNQGKSYIPDVSQKEFEPLVANGFLKATTDFSQIQKLDALSICVPTPLRKTKDPDISHIVNVVEAVSRYFKKGQLVVLESTTYPGTTEEVVLPILEGEKRKVGRDFFLAFSPERIDPGNGKYGTRDIPKIMGGITSQCTQRAVTLYESIIEKVISVSSAKVAEMVKLLENTFRAVNIGLVNEIAMLCRKMDLDVWEVIEGARSKPFGFMPFYPGPGLGGHCLPIDPIYLSWKAKLVNFETRFIDLAAQVNSHMPHHVVDIVCDALNRHGKALNGSKLLLLGMTYKKDVNDVRESPAIDVWKLLERQKAKVCYHDPYVSKIQIEGHVHYSQPLSSKTLKMVDGVVILTDHTVFDYEAVVQQSRLVIDTRNATKGVKNHRNKIVKI
ncbi:MAG: nucleotide sugar dehydrogenase [Chlamydiae bacterium]|nr:nucleotide sugar dehydrogenase [Chlamydiota bacterium]MBI3277191.1 nucleotide sugar dehydrogenase [Chlamydiota bacterium]